MEAWIQPREAYVQMPPPFKKTFPISGICSNSSSKSTRFTNKEPQTINGQELLWLSKSGHVFKSTVF